LWLLRRYLTGGRNRVTLISMDGANNRILHRLRRFLPGLAAVALLAGACIPSPGAPPPSAPSPAQPSPPASPPPANPSPAPSPPVGEPLPEPVISSNSVELCLNSRYSEHSLTGTANSQQIANVLWAAGKAPLAGAYRNIYVATPDGGYSYDPATNSLSPRSDQTASDGAFVVDCESALPFDTGVSYMLATLASVSQWKSGEAAMASCPKRTSLIFGVQEVRELTPELVARCSLPPGDPGWLPDPSTDGQNKLEDVLANLRYIDRFSAENLTLQQISQLLWAGYGCTPHEATLGGRKGLTVPSAMARYYLTGTIYLANENGVYRYQNRNPGNDLTTRDHRIEPVASSDARGELQAAVSSPSPAPAYIIICLGDGIAAQEQDWALMETGFVAGNVLVQASAMGLGCHFKAELTPDEQTAIQEATGIPSSDAPQVVISLGSPG
jgi:hypothetical protein